MIKTSKKKKYQPEVLNTFNYRGFKITEVLNRRSKRREFKVRFQVSNKEIYLTDERRKNLEETIDETLAQERRSKYNLPTKKHFPTVAELFAAHLLKLKKTGDRKKISIFERVSERLLDLFPAGIKTNELRKSHFQKYIESRLEDINPQSNLPILPETVNKELSSISVAFKRAAHYFAELENEQMPEIPKAEITKGGRRRERLVDKQNELEVLLEYLRRAHRNRKTAAARRRLADDLEIRYETGLRRAEAAILEKSQYRREESALRNVKRIKTGTITKFFPLTRRATEIIESRLDSDSKYIFSTNGKPNEAAYAMLKRICEEKLNIPYGAFKEGGFVPHDLRHNFATDIIRVTDIETAKSLTGHTGEHILTYLHTNEDRMREAVRAREGTDLTEYLTALYNDVKADKLDLAAFLERAKSLIKNGQVG